MVNLARPELGAIALILACSAANPEQRAAGTATGGQPWPGSGGSAPSSGGSAQGGRSSAGSNTGGASAGSAAFPAFGGAAVARGGSGPSTAGGGVAAGATSAGGIPASNGGRAEAKGGASSAGMAPTEGGTAGGGTAGRAASGGRGGSTPEVDCPDQLVGWASVAGDDVPTTTGGGNATPVRPASNAELEEYAGDEQPRVIELTKNFDVASLSIASNKTLIGVGSNVTINGGLRIRSSGGDRVRNVIVKNLRVNGSTSDVDGDAVQLYNADHVWIDHVEIYDGADGNLDVVHGSNWVTISWSRFRYTSAAPDAKHRFSTLIGHSDDNDAEDSGRLNVSLHHNHFGEGVIERMPRARFGKVHSFNNYFAASGNNYCIRAGRGAQLLIENNYFEGVKSPHEFNNDEDQPTAHITQRGNVYVNTSGNQAENGGGTPFANAPYPVTLDAADDVPALVRSCAGPR